MGLLRSTKTLGVGCQPRHWGLELTNMVYMFHNAAANLKPLGVGRHTLVD